MSFSVAKEHVQFFNQNSQIEFEGLLNSQQILSLSKVVDTLFKPSAQGKLTPGIDLWREHQTLKPILCSNKLATIAGQLTNNTALRYGFSQVVSSSCYSDTETFLYRKSILTKIVCGLCLCIKPSKEPASPFFPTEEGAGIYFDIDPDFYLRFPKSDGVYLFIFYTGLKARFYMQDDLTEHESYFKKLGYKNGDFLTDSRHPSFTSIVL